VWKWLLLARRPVSRRVAHFELRPQVLPLVVELPGRDCHPHVAPIRNLAGIERELALPSLVEHARKVRVNRRAG
jgi:hypothetical protein